MTSTKLKAPSNQVCRRCKELKPAERFSKCTRASTGLHVYCKPCQATRTKVYGITGSTTGSLPTDPVELRLKLALNSTKKSSYARKRLKGKPYDIDYPHLRALYDQQGGRCAVSGRTLQLGDEGTGGRKGFAKDPDSLSVDRIDPSRGYVKGNIRLVTINVNVAMQRWGDEAFLDLCRDVVAFSDASRKRASESG